MIGIYFLKGFVAGFAIAVPVGPVGMLCIRRTLHFGRISGYVTGVGAASADTLFAIIAASGLSFISDYIFRFQSILQGIGGLLLIGLAIRTLSLPPQQVALDRKNLIKDFISSWGLTIANPLTIIAFGTMFAALKLIPAAWNVFVGVFFGSFTWWLILTELVARLRSRVRQEIISFVINGAIIFVMVTGVVLLIKSFL